jgi:fructose-specific phosphotransferase system IIA component
MSECKVFNIIISRAGEGAIVVKMSVNLLERSFNSTDKLISCRFCVYIDEKYIVLDLVSMILTQILQPNCVKVPVESRDKETVITELVDLLDANGLLLNRDEALEAVITRERTRSTGTGAGIAIPHGKCTAVKDIVMAIGVAHDPIEFESVDRQPVKILILLLSPIDQTGSHIQALAGISRLMLNEEVKQKLEQAASADEVYELLNDAVNE